MQTVQLDDLRFSVIGTWLLGALVLFLLGTFADALRKTDEWGSPIRHYYHKGTWGSVITVYVTVCIPLTWSAYSASSQLTQPGFLVTTMASIFLAGRYLEALPRTTRTQARNDSTEADPERRQNGNGPDTPRDDLPSPNSEGGDTPKSSADVAG